MLKSLGKIVRRNKIFSYLQSISIKIFFNYCGGFKIYPTNSFILSLQKVEYNSLSLVGGLNTVTYF